MLRKRRLRSSAIVGLLLVFCLAVAGARGLAKRRATPRPDGFARVGLVTEGVEKISQVVFIIKENRTFDNYFGTFPGANGATSVIRSSPRSRRSIRERWTSST